MGKKWKRLRLARRAAAKRIVATLTRETAVEVTAAAPVETVTEILSAPLEVEFQEVHPPEPQKSRKTAKPTTKAPRKPAKRRKTRKATSSSTQSTT